MPSLTVPDALAEPARRMWGHRRAGPAIKLAAGCIGLYAVIQLVFGPSGVGNSAVPAGIFVQGIVVGSLYALIGMGLILVYRANRIINFAQAGLGAVPAVLALILVTQGMSYWLAIPIVLVGGAVLGAGVSGLIEAFRKAPRLIVTVVTIGVSLFLAFIEFWIPSAITGESLPPSDLPTPLSGTGFRVGIMSFTGDHIFTVLVVGLIVVGLGAFFRYTDVGIAVRASAENADRAALLGIPVRRITVIVWSIAAVMSAIGVFLRAPLIGLPIGGLVGPSVLLFALAAAVIARMESLPVAFVAGMAMGVIDQSAVFATRRSSLATASMLVVILGALLVQKKRMARAYDAEQSSFRMVREWRPIPLELRGLAEVRIAQGILWTLIAAVALAGPMLFGAGRESLASLIVIYAIIGVSLVMLTGWAGQISLGQFGIAGIGAVTAAALHVHLHQDFFVAMAGAGLAGAAAAVGIGLPAVRIQGLFLAVTTLAFAFTVENFVLNTDYFGWLLPGDFEFVERPMLYGRFDMSDMRAFYYLCLGFLVLSLLVARSVRNSRSGRVLMGVRENTRQMQAVGVSVARTRLSAFAISGFIAAVAGGLIAYYSGSISASSFVAERSILIFVMVVIGGIASLPGAVLGAAYVLGLPEIPGLRNIELVDLLTSSVGIIAVLLFLPGGLSEGFYRARNHYLRWVAARHDVVVPSLVADVQTDREPEVVEDTVIRQASERAEGAEETAELTEVRR